MQFVVGRQVVSITESCLQSTSCLFQEWAVTIPVSTAVSGAGNSGAADYQAKTEESENRLVSVRKSELSCFACLS